ncbi:uncharacterized protein LOC130689709 [Daphnia carinata]|uniref:uncharacterized protein LOC130689709 n=1 Tax=Daphnia carinata TaxID=120202 RepID=UPI00257BEF08|nr:uncharacterized protein LOC130689709 [Daphnia carinata]
MLTHQNRIVFFIWISSIHFFKDGDAITGQRLYKYTEDPLVEHVVLYPWLNPVYETSYQPPSLRDDYGEARPHADRSRLFWTRLLNGFRKGKPYTMNPATNGQTLGGVTTGIELANNFAAALGEEGMKRLAALVAAYLSPGPAGPPGSSWQFVPNVQLRPNGEKGDNGQLGGSFPTLPDISQWLKGEKGEKGERGDCGCNEVPTTLGPTTTIDTTVITTSEGTTGWPSTSTEGPTDWPTTSTESPTEWPTTSTEGPVVTTDETTTLTTAFTTDVQTTPDATTTTSPVVTTEESFGTIVESTTLEVTTPTDGPTTPTDSITEELTTTITEPTTNGLSTEVSTTSTDEPATITDSPTTPTGAPITTTEGQTTTIDEVTRPTDEQTPEVTTNIPTTTIVWPTISTDFSVSTTDTTEILTTREGQTTTNEVTTIPTTTSYPPVTEPIVADCRESIHHRNATWQSPDSFDPEQTSNACVLSIQLNSAEDTDVQGETICQIRLDFREFSIAQPNRQSKCATDSFRVFNAENKVPTLCGENSGQHLYVTPRSGTNGVQLGFKFGPSPISRLWKIDIILIPCCANHMLPPNDCLQYFNDFGGIVKSFNWMDSTHVKRPLNHPRQLANQQYNICFKANSLAKSICYTPCPSAGLAFSVSQNAGQGPFRAGVGVTHCKEDFLLIANGYDRFDRSKRNDRFCGTIFNPDGNVTVSQSALIASASTTICSDIKPFQIHYTTNGNELPDDVANNGFCLQYEQEYLTKHQILSLDHDLPEDK